MTFLDTNVPMYLIGADARLRTQTENALLRLSGNGERLVTDVEIFQEILHRYAAISRREAIQPAFDTLRSLVSKVFAIDMAIIEEARSLMQGYPQLGARDAIHAAVIKRNRIPDILTFDTGFDHLPFVRRVAIGA